MDRASAKSNEAQSFVDTHRELKVQSPALEA
jgi:hypothetical protein